MIADMIDPLVQLAIQIGFLKPECLDEALKLQTLLSGNQLSLTLSEILVRKEWLTAEQLRAIHIVLRYEEMRQLDERLGARLVERGLVPSARVRECLDRQLEPFREGAEFPRLEDLLAQSGHLSPQALEAAREAPSPQEPQGTRPTGDPAARAPQQPVKPSSPTAKPLPSHSQTHRRVAAGEGLAMDGCKIALRRSKVKDSQGRENEIGVLDVDGVLDGHTFKSFEDLLEGLVEQGLGHLVLNFQKLDYISSAGIGVLAGAVKKCREAKGDIRLCNVQDKVKRTINLVGLQSMLRIYDHERGAILSFKYL